LRPSPTLFRASPIVTLLGSPTTFCGVNVAHPPAKKVANASELMQIALFMVSPFVVTHCGGDARNIGQISGSNFPDSAISSRLTLGVGLPSPHPSLFVDRSVKVGYSSAMSTCGPRRSADAWLSYP